MFQGSLLESGGRPVTRRAEQAIWPADALPGILSAVRLEIGLRLSY
ncbi:hypothetical protein ACLB1M_19945 [Escherichia coli]